MLTWTTDKPITSGTYKIRPLPQETLVVGSQAFTDEQEVEIEYVRGMKNKGLFIFFGFSAIEVAGTQMEYYGPLEPLA